MRNTKDDGPVPCQRKLSGAVWRDEVHERVTLVLLALEGTGEVAKVVRASQAGGIHLGQKLCLGQLSWQIANHQRRDYCGIVRGIHAVLYILFDSLLLAQPALAVGAVLLLLLLLVLLVLLPPCQPLFQWQTQRLEWRLSPRVCPALGRLGLTHLFE